jgi:hypothetical protein
LESGLFRFFGGVVVVVVPCLFPSPPAAFDNMAYNYSNIQKALAEVVKFPAQLVSCNPYVVVKDIRALTTRINSPLAPNQNPNTK